MPKSSTITITFGDVAENHVRMQKLGTLASEGFSVSDLQRIMENFVKIGCDCEMISLPFIPHESKVQDLNARVLVVRNGVDKLLKVNSDDLFKELSGLDWDKKAKMKGKIVNKHARWNLCFDDVPQAPNYMEGQGRVIPYSQIPLTKRLKDELENIVGDKGQNLVAEGNYYYNNSKCYIGYHGDAERRLVIGVRFGATFPLHYQWYLKGGKMGARTDIELGNGDIYFMSDVAVGWNWMKRNVPTLRHSAGNLNNVG